MDKFEQYQSSTPVAGKATHPPLKLRAQGYSDPHVCTKPCRLLIPSAKCLAGALYSNHRKVSCPQPRSHLQRQGLTLATA
jgi:hypothetical protein